MSDDDSQVTARVAGVYQVHVRLSMVNTSLQEGTVLVLLVNTIAVAGCSQCNAQGHTITPQLFEILRLQVNDTLQVRSHSLDMSGVDHLVNRFSLTYLGK